MDGFPLDNLLHGGASRNLPPLLINWMPHPFTPTLWTLFPCKHLEMARRNPLLLVDVVVNTLFLLTHMINVSLLPLFVSVDVCRALGRCIGCNQGQATITMHSIAH